jgi:hypothetical protein
MSAWFGADFGCKSVPLLGYSFSGFWRLLALRRGALCVGHRSGVSDLRVLDGHPQFDLFESQLHLLGMRGGSVEGFREVGVGSRRVCSPLGCAPRGLGYHGFEMLAWYG